MRARIARDEWKLYSDDVERIKLEHGKMLAMLKTLLSIIENDRVKISTTEMRDLIAEIEGD